MTGTPMTRDFTVAVFVMSGDRVILHPHRKLGIWLPPGGHIEPNELPDEAARREVLEEAGIEIDLVGPRGIPADYPGQPIQLVRPEGIQLETIGPGHEHIDLVYFARPVGQPDTLPDLADGMEWIAAADLDRLPVTGEVRDWCRKALATAAAW
ncbi:MAG TPA: NUDIX domain-containing protein [Thermomicrobiales bacterium]|nr:NUDIX domain-containing protein [Thermomicrobiales bacterium]